MRTITFVALQCFQCSTMQVKQQKKSSNKWTCVVCNQKQSVRKVFAQGPLAKDLRLFVQSFNMSRTVTDEQRSPDPETQMPTSPLQGGEDCTRKRRSDWNEYLDLEPDDKEEGGDLGPRVLTELPKELFKKPKLKNYASESNNLNINDKEARKDQISEANTTSKCINDDRKTRTSQTTVAAKSKWSSYITQVDDELRVGRGTSIGDKMGEFRHNDDVWETLMEDYKVDDDVHPDFV